MTFYYLTGLYRNVQSIVVSPENEPELFSLLSKSPIYFKTLEEAYTYRTFIQWKQNWKQKKD